MSKRIEEILDVLNEIRIAHRNDQSASARELRLRVLPKVAEKHEIALQTVQDKYLRQLRPHVENVADFDKLVDKWLATGATTLKTILDQHAVDSQDNEAIREFFGAHDSSYKDISLHRKEIRESRETWRNAVMGALQRYSSRHKTRIISERKLTREELGQIVRDAGYQGTIDDLELSRVLQELRDEGVLVLLSNGEDLLLDTPLDVESEDLPVYAIDAAIVCKKLRVGAVSTDEAEALVRQRRGQARIRELTLLNYGTRCAFCDVTDRGLLIAAHIVRWADGIEARGDLSNTICFCRFHDVLFENGLIALSDDYHILKKPYVRSRTIGLLLQLTTDFRQPKAHPPAPEYLRKHRIRTGFEL
jgi:predicted restriction endonuclease